MPYQINGYNFSEYVYAPATTSAPAALLAAYPQLPAVAIIASSLNASRINTTGYQLSSTDIATTYPMEALTQIYSNTTPGSIVLPAWCNRLSGSLIGAGGGGGGSGGPTGGPGNGGNANPGGYGAANFFENSPVTPGTTCTYTIGTGGSAGAAGGTSGGPGGFTRITKSGGTILGNASGGNGGGGGNNAGYFNNGNQNAPAGTPSAAVSGSPAVFINKYPTGVGGFGDIGRADNTPGAGRTGAAGKQGAMWLWFKA